MNFVFGKPKPRSNVVWDKSADDLLRKSGNYALDQIHEEFELDPEKEAVRIDADLPFFLTPVARRRYSVIWRRNDAAGKPIYEVSAVVPVRFARVAEGMTLKERVKKAVSQESDGRVELDF